MVFRILGVLVVLVLLASCSTQRAIKHSWPDAMPERSYFESVYAADTDNQKVQSEADYLMWVVRYYEGWELYRRGWKKATRELLANIDDPVKAQQLELKMADIGRSISAEWAKKTKQRVIYTRHVSVWGNALLDAIARGEEWHIVSEIQQDVHNLLARKIPVEAITAERYYARGDDDPFW